MIFQHQCQSVFMLITTIKQKLPFPQYEHVVRRCLSEWEMEKLEGISHTMHTHSMTEMIMRFFFEDVVIFLNKLKKASMRVERIPEILKIFWCWKINFQAIKQIWFDFNPEIIHSIYITYRDANIKIYLVIMIAQKAHLFSMESQH